MLPNFLIIGAQKCGTTALAYSLRKHPEVFLPKAKEAHHFGTVAGDSVGGIAYREFFKDWRGEPHIGEATPNYLTLPNAAQQIHTVLPNVRLVVSLRNPVDRAYSAYWHALREGAVRGSFEQVISAPEQLALNRRWSGIISDGRYHRYLMNYKRLFKQEQIHIIIHEDLIAHPSKTLVALANFLGIGDPSLFPAPKQNQTSRSKLPHFMRSLLVQHFPAFHKRTLIPFIPPPMQPDTRATLCRFYRSDNEKLADCLGRDLSQWSQLSTPDLKGQDLRMTPAARTLLP